MNDPTLPTISLNGTDPKDIFKAYTEARHALRHLTNLIPHPNHRDYYLGEPGAGQQALRETETVLRSLAEIDKFLVAHQMHAANHIREHSA